MTNPVDSQQPPVDRQQLYSVLVMIGASRRELHALHSAQLPALGMNMPLVLEPVQEAEASLEKVEQFLRVFAKSHFADLEIPWENE